MDETAGQGRNQAGQATTTPSLPDRIRVIRLLNSVN